MHTTDSKSLPPPVLLTVINNVILHSFPISKGQMCNYIVASSSLSDTSETCKFIKTRLDKALGQSVQIR